MVALFMKKLVAAVVASHVAIVTGLHFYKKQRILESSPYKTKSEEEKLLDWLTDLDGVPLVKDIASNVRKLDGFNTRHDDIYIVSYPKSGTTWVSELAYNIVHKLDIPKAKSKPLDERVPYLEWVHSNHHQLESMPHSTPRIIKSHLPLKLLPNSITNGKHKIVYIMRNPRDVCVSYYHFTKMIQMVGYNGEFSNFFDLFLVGSVAYGSWPSHVQEYYTYSLSSGASSNVLFITYEELVKDPIKTIEKLAQFLDTPLSSEQLQLLSYMCSFSSMKNNPSSNYQWLAVSGFLKDDAQFLRKGTVGDWQNHFSPDMASSLDSLLADSIKDDGLLKLIDYEKS